MMEITLEPKRSVNDEMQRKLNQLIKKIENPILANYEVSTRLQRWVWENFDTEGGKVGGWKPLKLGGRWKGKGKDRYFQDDAVILNDTGALRLSINHFYGKDFAGVGSDLPYSKTHDLGLPPHIPQRRILPTEDDKSVKDLIIEIYETYIKRYT